jgi:hypothetical protein
MVDDSSSTGRIDMTKGESKIALFRYTFIVLALAWFAGSSWAAATGAPEFKGKIAESYQDSVEWWPQTVPTPPKGAPNVLIIVLDDVGFAQIGSYGGLSATPNIDKLADEGCGSTTSTPRHSAPPRAPRSWPAASPTPSAWGATP